MTTYRRMRRQARLARRSGLQPMMMINTGDGFPETAGVLLARWAWRYRSELTPVAVAAGLVAAAWWLHATRPHWWLPVAVLAGVAAWAAALFGGRWRLPTLPERVYAAITIYVAGIWLSAATAVGPKVTPLPQALVIGAVMLSVPWWAHRRRRAKVRIERKLQAWPDIAKAIGLAGTEVMRPRHPNIRGGRNGRPNHTTMSSSGPARPVAPWPIGSARTPTQRCCCSRRSRRLGPRSVDPHPARLGPPRPSSAGCMIGCILSSPRQTPTAGASNAPAARSSAAARRSMLWPMSAAIVPITTVGRPVARQLVLCSSAARISAARKPGKVALTNIAAGMAH